MTVYAVLAHDQPEMLDLIIRALAGRKVVVHADLKARITLPDLPYVTEVAERVDVSWGGFSVVEAMINLFAAALERAEPGEHVVLMSGRCFPVRPVAEFEHYLSRCHWSEHCRAGWLLDGDLHSERRIRQRWLFDLFPPRRGGIVGVLSALARQSLRVLLPRRRRGYLHDLGLCAGSQWIGFTRECLSELMVSARDPAIQKPFRAMLAPDEMFFHTLLYRSGWAMRAEWPTLAPYGARRTADFANFTYVKRALSGDIEWADVSRARDDSFFFARKVAPPVAKQIMREYLSAGPSVVDDIG